MEALQLSKSDTVRERARSGWCNCISVARTSVLWQGKHFLVNKAVRGNSWAGLLTSVSGPLSAPGQENVTNSWHLLWTTKQQTVGDGARERKERKGYVKIQCFIINGYTGSRKTWSSDNTKRNWRKTDVWARLPIMCPDGQSCLQADCSYWTVQCHLLTDMTGAKADTTYTNSHSILCTWSTPKANRFTGWQNCLTCIHRIHIQTHTLECICLHAVRVTLSV